MTNMFVQRDLNKAEDILTEMTGAKVEAVINNKVYSFAFATDGQVVVYGELTLKTTDKHRFLNMVGMVLDLTDVRSQ